MDLAEIQTRIEKLPLGQQNIIFKELVKLVNKMDFDIPKMQIAQKTTESREKDQQMQEKIAGFFVSYRTF